MEGTGKVRTSRARQSVFGGSGAIDLPVTDSPYISVPKAGQGRAGGNGSLVCRCRT